MARIRDASPPPITSLVPREADVLVAGSGITDCPGSLMQGVLTPGRAAPVKCS